MQCDGHFKIAASTIVEAEDKGPCHVDIVASICPQRVTSLVVREQVNEYFQCNVISIISG